jgi:gas vesicle protein
MKISDVSDLSKNDILSALGLAIKPSTSERVAGSLGLIGLGAIIGAGVALLLAPSSGEDLRSDLGQRIRRYAPESPLTDRNNGRENESRQST